MSLPLQAEFVEAAQSVESAVAYCFFGGGVFGVVRAFAVDL